jgi:hypothetical protein
VQPNVQLSLELADAPPAPPTVLALLPNDRRAAAVATLARLIAKAVDTDGARTGERADGDE